MRRSLKVAGPVVFLIVTALLLKRANFSAIDTALVAFSAGYLACLVLP